MVYGALSQQPYVWAQEPGERGTKPAVYGYNGVKIPPSVSQRPYVWGASEDIRFRVGTFTSSPTTQQPYLYNHRYTRATDIPGVYTGTPTPLIGFIHLPPEMEAKIKEVVAGVVPTEFDWGSFSWGILAGGIIVAVAGGIVLYFAWPTIATALGLYTLIPKWMRRE